MSDRTQQIKEYFRKYFMGDMIEDRKQFNLDVFKAIKELEEEYRDAEKIVGIHVGCGGNIITKDQCRYCDRCGQYFCGCACG